MIRSGSGERDSVVSRVKRLTPVPPYRPQETLSPPIVPPASSPTLSGTDRTRRDPLPLTELDGGPSLADMSQLSVLASESELLSDSSFAVDLRWAWEVGYPSLIPVDLDFQAQ